MSALLLALILSIVLDQGSGSQRIVSHMGDRFGATGTVISGLTLAVISNAALAAIAGGVLGELMPANARLLFFACTLSIGGTGLLLATIRAPNPAAVANRSHLRIIGALALRRTGENATLAIVGTALLSQAPLLTAAGAIMGTMPALLAALLLGKRYVAIMPTRPICAITGTILICIAMVCAVRALGLTGA